MKHKILWAPIRWPDNRHIETDSVGTQCEAIFTESLDAVSDVQWSSCDAIVSLLDVPASARELATNCRIVVTPKVGFDNIALQAWGERGVPVCNVPDYGTMEVADHAIALMLSLMRGITFHTRELKRDLVANWRPALNPFGKRLSVSKLGIVGLGRIGMATALRARAFGMDVQFYDPYVENGRDKALGIKRIDRLESLFSDCDVVSLHTPLTAETNCFIDANVLAHSHPRLILINTARGPVIDLDALHQALKSDQLLAAGLDVLPQEPPQQNHPLLRAWHNNESWIDHRLIITPHHAFCTEESMYDMRFSGGACAAKFLTTGVLENCVNRTYLSSAL